MSIGLYRGTLRRWGLSDIPFSPTPPEDLKELSRLFYGRQAELELALPALYEGRNVLVRGLWGVGKTVFIRYLLHRLKMKRIARIATIAIIPMVNQNNIPRALSVNIPLSSNILPPI